jgi:predicted nuclease of predicted toxin-antitoxin system
VRKLRYFLDENMPCLSNQGLDVVHAREAGKTSDPDPLVLNQARSSRRILVTQDHWPLRPGAVPRRHGGIVVVKPANVGADLLALNLRTLQKCIFGCIGLKDLAGEVLVLEINERIIHKRQDGYLHQIH